MFQLSNHIPPLQHHPAQTPADKKKSPLPFSLSSLLTTLSSLIYDLLNTCPPQPADQQQKLVCKLVP